MQFCPRLALGALRPADDTEGRPTKKGLVRTRLQVAGPPGVGKDEEGAWMRHGNLRSCNMREELDVTHSSDVTAISNVR